MQSLCDYGVNVEERTVSSRVFADPNVFAHEQAAIFTKSWLYVGHRSQFDRAGAFIQAFAGTIPLVVSLDNNGRFHAMANVCSHRGSRICQVEYGHAEKFVCPYHNWVYNNVGDLVSVPRCPSSFDKSKWHLYRASRVETYRDLIFATFSPETVGLEEYLGDMRWYLDLVLNSSSAGTEVSAGTHRSILHCNWKIPAEQFASDSWHLQAVHASMAKLGMKNQDPRSEDSFHVWTSQGHGLICAASRSDFPNTFSEHLDQLLSQGQISPVQRRLLKGYIILTIFPNLSIVFSTGLCSIRVWHPRRPDRTELWSWALYNKDAPDKVKAGIRRQVTQMFSPTGMLEQDDLEVWARLAANLSNMPGNFRLCYTYAPEEHCSPNPFPGKTASLQSDEPAFAFYVRWAEMMAEG